VPTLSQSVRRKVQHRKTEWPERLVQNVVEELALIVSCLIGSFGPLGSTAPYHLDLSALRSPASENVDRRTHGRAQLVPSKH
jgi:hypothetical protein